MTNNSFNIRDTFTVDGTTYTIHRLDRISDSHRLPCLKVMLENLLRNEDNKLVTVEQVRAVAGWQPDATPRQEV
jgi:aconitate hydratase